MQTLTRGWFLLKSRALRTVNRRRFEREWLRDLPDAFAPAARFAYYRDWSPEERRIARDIESFRAHIPVVAGASDIESLGSPHSGTFSLDERGLARGAAPTRAPIARHALTGVRPFGGTLLRRLVTGIRATRILELGTNTGFSGCYFVSAETRPRLVTVEGSAAMCAIAQVNLARFSSDVVLKNALFDEALSELTATGERFDCAYIDGQHERRATLHYAARVAPLINEGGIIIFDDLYWSGDMNLAWRDICASRDFGLTIDFGAKGLAMPGGTLPKRHFDLCDIAGRPPIGRPRW